MGFRGDDRSKQNVWHETWKRINRILPDLKGDVITEQSTAGNDEVMPNKGLSPPGPKSQDQDGVKQDDY